MNTFKREACFRCYVSQFKTSITYCSHCTFKIYDMLCVFMDISQHNPCQLKCHSFNHFTEVYPTETLNATSLSVENKGSNKKMICFQKRTPWRKDVKFQTTKTTNVTVNNVFLSRNYSYLKTAQLNKRPFWKDSRNRTENTPSVWIISNESIPLTLHYNKEDYKEKNPRK